jgi:hypothetical protein
MTAKKAGTFARTKKKADDLVPQIWKTLCPVSPEDSPPQFAPIAARLYASLGIAIGEASNGDRQVLRSLAAKDGASLTQVSKSLFDVLIKVRGFSRVCKPAEKNDETRQLPGAPLVYEDLDLGEIN